MATNYFVYPPLLHALGTFPVIQQVSGAFCAVSAIALSIYSLAKLCFAGIGKLAGSKEINIPYVIQREKQELRIAGHLFLFGVVTFIPVIGTITNAVLWYKVTHRIRELEEIRVARGHL